MKYIIWIISCIIHRFWVLFHILQFCNELIKRAQKHDNSKYSIFEIKGFAEVFPKLKNSTYGSLEYKSLLHDLKITLQHHYFRNRHHPEYHKQGINNMNLIDIVEMWCDWKSAIKKHKDGDINNSIKVNSKRFKMGKVLTEIFKNTVETL